MYKQGDRVFWKAINRNYSGVVVGFHGPFAIVRIDNSNKVILYGEPKTNKKWKNTYSK